MKQIVLRKIDPELKELIQKLKADRTKPNTGSGVVRMILKNYAQLSAEQERIKHILNQIKELQ